jgi:hypothetical protein
MPSAPASLRVLLLAGALAGSVACGGSKAGNPGRPDPGISVEPSPSADETAERARVAAALSAVAGIDPTGLVAKYPTSFAASLGYDPMTATNPALIRGSRLGLNAAEEQVLARNGFVISDRQRFPTFAYGYASIYADDLPVFISADSLLYAVHRSYDELLKQIEIGSLRPALQTLLWPRVRRRRWARPLSRTSISTWRSRRACSMPAPRDRSRAVRPPRSRPC